LQSVKAAADRGDELAQTAIDMLCYRIATAIGAYAVALGGMRALTFTGGIGENAAFVRAQVCAQLAPLGVAIDEARNERGLPTIHAPHSRVSVHVIAANEELHIARLVLGGQYHSNSAH
jgi:acetate kinase